jgi:AcrR family transcriptional regulator
LLDTLPLIFKETMGGRARLGAVPGSAADRRPDPPRRPANRERVNARGDATRALILTTAEQLFAENGIAVALRDIGTAAGQKNNVAVQYHFGDRESLIREIISYRAVTSEEHRTEMLADLIAEGQQPHVADLVKAFIIPLATHLEAGNHYLAFLSRYIIERGGYIGLDSYQFTVPPPGGTVNTLRSILGRLLPQCPEELLEERWTIMMTSAVHTLARYQALISTNKLPTPLHELLEDLVTFLSAGIQAPSSQSPRRPEALQSLTGKA